MSLGSSSYRHGHPHGPAEPGPALYGSRDLWHIFSGADIIWKV